jgi:hypothetical protein
MLDTETARWFNVDPLTQKYYRWSPYAYAADNPVRFIDTDGKRWLDAKGNLVWNNGAYTRYATADHIRIGSALMRTKTGMVQFEKLVNHAAPIQTVINITDAPIKIQNGKPGRVNGMIERQRTTDTRTGKRTLKYATITLYEKNLKLRAQENGVTLEEQLGATTGHEIEHTDEENVQLPNNDPNEETKPKAVAAAIIEEFKQQKPISPRDLDVGLDDAFKKPKYEYYDINHLKKHY